MSNKTKKLTDEEFVNQAIARGWAPLSRSDDVFIVEMTKEQMKIVHMGCKALKAEHDAGLTELSGETREELDGLVRMSDVNDPTVAPASRCVNGWAL